MDAAPARVDSRPEDNPAGPLQASPEASERQTAQAPEPAVPAGFVFKGLLIFRGDVQIDGEVTGEIESRGILHLGELSRVQARVSADDLIIAGDFEGDATAGSRITLLPTARVRGNLEAPRIALADGCLFLGRCRSGSPSARAPLESEPSR